MQSSYELNAYHFSKRIQLKNVSIGDGFKTRLHTPYELVLEKNDHQYVFFYNFGSVVFVNWKAEEKEEFLKLISHIFLLNVSTYKFDDYIIEINPEAENFHKLGFNKVVFKKMDFDAVRVIALLIGQSVALDYHQSLTGDLLVDTKDISEELKNKGSSSRNIKKLVKYMGTCMSTKQSLVADLYIYDEPDETWDDQHLSKLFEDLRRHLELQSRFKNIYYDLDMIQQSSVMVADLIQIRKQNALELTIIALIAFEVVWAIVDRLQ